MQLVALILLAWTHVGWSLFLRLAVPAGWGRSGTPAAAAGPGAADAPAAAAGAAPPPTSVIVAAYAEEAVIARTVAALLAQEPPPLEVIVACDGSPDATAARARDAGAHVVLELPRGGKHAAQEAGIARASGELLSFCDANTTWEPGALHALTAPFADPAVGYACGHVRFVTNASRGSDPSDASEPNQEGAYWALELATRRLESAWWSVTAGNGAIYAVRTALWPRLRTDLGHDLALPHQVVRLGGLAVDVPGASAVELMVPSIDGEWRRKRRMMARMWGIVARDPGAGGLLDPRGLPPRYLLALVSHRWLRYASPALHVLALAAGLRAVAGGGRSNGSPRWVGPTTVRLANRAALAAQLAVLAGAAAPSLARTAPAEGSHVERFARAVRARPLLLCRYYVLMTASIAAGGLDRLRDGPPEAGWSPPEGTR